MAGAGLNVLGFLSDPAASLISLATSRRKYGHTLAVAWFDAHGCLRPPSSGHRSALAEAMTGADRISGGRAALIGARKLSTAEWVHVWQGRVRHLTVAAARKPVVVSNCLLETDAEEVYLHVGLDVLDPTEFAGVPSPVSGGMTVAEVASAVRAIAAALPVVGAAVTGYSTTDPDQLRRLMPLLDAVGEVCAQRS